MRRPPDPPTAHGGSIDAMREPVTVYWRPGCGYCAALRRRLDHAEIPYREINIWDDPDAAAWVRSVNRGNETVPTVRIGDTSLTNPTIDDVQAAFQLS